MAGSDAGDNTEAPTGRRLERAREEGNIAQSRELHLFSGLGLASIALVMVLPTGTTHFVAEMRGMIANAGQIELDAATCVLLLQKSVKCLMLLAFPVVIAAVAGGVTTAVLQSGFLLRVEALVPDITRLNPLRGIKRIFSSTSIIEAIKSLLKLGVFSFILYGVAKDTVMLSSHAMSWSPLLFVKNFYQLIMRAIVAVLVVQVVIIVLDEGWTRYKRLQDLKMSRHDIKEEMKETDGDPHIKGKLKQMRMRRSRKRMADAVKKATVVITNPTHYAVALAYEAGTDKAPRVVAKGADEIAARIREFAHAEKVPIVSNPPLARALYTLPEDTEIPYEYFQTVAAVIAYVWKLKRPATTQPPVM